MTAVEWFMEQIGEKQPNGLYVIDTLEDVKNVFEQAKEMENQNEKKMYSEEEVKKMVWESRLFYHLNKDIPFSKIRDDFNDYFNRLKKKY